MLRSSDCKTPLAKQMVERAEMDGIPSDHPLRVYAEEIDEVTHDHGVKRLLGRWARARKAWSDYSGEPLI